MLLFDNLKYRIYCDMDGVLVDFNKGYEELTGIELDGTYQTSEEFWAPINSSGKEFWENLEWMPDGKRLWEYIDEYYPVILSSPSRRGFGSREGKKNWIDRELPGTPLILEYSFNKRKHAKSNHILIDDRDSNIEQWIESGGIGILHTSTEDTLEQLNKFGL
jgi:5'(3')-deoxyribonucleotidase